MFYFVLFYKSRIQHESDISFAGIFLGDIVTKPDLGLLAWQAARSIYWHQVVVKESTAFITGCQEKEWTAHAQEIWILQWFPGKGF